MVHGSSVPAPVAGDRERIEWTRDALAAVFRELHVDAARYPRGAVLAHGDGEMTEPVRRSGAGGGGGAGRAAAQDTVGGDEEEGAQATEVGGGSAGGRGRPAPPRPGSGEDTRARGAEDSPPPPRGAEAAWTRGQPPQTLGWSLLSLDSLRSFC